MNIITVGREFGSGGRELGKRLADALGVSCYDQEIIDEVARRHGLDSAHVEHISEMDIRAAYPMTIGRRFSTPLPNQNMKLLISKQEVIKTLAGQGDCIVVGHCADIFLQDLHPLNLFVYADQESKLARCIRRAAGDESPRSILRQMERIDRERRAHRELFSDGTWGHKENYHLCINTSGWEIKALVPVVAQYAQVWFAVNRD